MLILSLLVGFFVGFIDRKQSADRQVKKYPGEIKTEALMSLFDWSAPSQSQLDQSDIENNTIWETQEFRQL